MNDPTLDPTHLAALIVPMMFFGLILTVVMVVPYWFIFKKAGFSPWFSILMFVPLVNIVILYVIAFSQWKVVPIPPYSVTAHAPQSYPPQIYPPQYPPQS